MICTHSPTIVRAVKSRGMRCTLHISHMGQIIQQF